MRRLVHRAAGLATTLALSTFVLGCPLLKKKAQQQEHQSQEGQQDERVEDEPVTKAQTTEVRGTGAKNEKDVLRYAKEVKLSDEPDTIGKDDVKAKSFPGGGAEIAKLPKGTAVTKLAKYFSTAVLVTWDDPSGDGKLMGWVLPDQLGGGAAAPPTTTGRPLVPAARTDAGTSLGKDAGVSAADAGTGTKDAGAGAKDAGPAAPDAGAPRISGAQLFVPLPSDGHCPTGFAPAPGGCRRPCNTTADCPRSTTCAPLDGKKFCRVQ